MVQQLIQILCGYKIPCNIYNVLVYDGAITGEEIKNIYEIDKTRYKNEKEENLSYNTEEMLVYLDGEDAPVDNMWKDRSGNNNDAVMSGTYTHDAENKSYNFTTEEGHGKITKFDYTNGITISSLVEMTAADGNNWYHVGNGYYGAPPSRPSFAFNTATFFMMGGNNSGHTTYYTTSTNRLYTITMTISSNGTGKTYINGKLMATANLATSFPATPANDFRIRGYGTTANTYQSAESLLPVNIYNVIVYDKELSQDEVKHIHAVDEILIKNKITNK